MKNDIKARYVCFYFIFIKCTLVIKSHQLSIRYFYEFFM